VKKVTPRIRQKKELSSVALYGIVIPEPMSEFKFACPVCGQHITADSTTSGGQIECPTCFQKIVVPQAPSSADPKFILSASQVSKPRPAPSGTDSQSDPSRTSPARTAIPIAALVLLLCAAGAVLYVFRAKIFRSAGSEAQSKSSQSAKPHPAAPMTIYAIPTNFNWTLDLTNAAFPEALAAGSIHRSGFRCEKATLQGGNLTLRQGKAWPPDLALSVVFFALQGEDLSGKSIEITPNRTPPLPRVTIRWKEEPDKAISRNINSGYALKAVFGEAAGGRMPGRIYICLPDDAKSFVAGTFDAEIKKAPPPKPKQPKGPQAPKPGG
jgi:DNA-directed RNA polymerase subunit RPC12/RpoP